MRILGLMASSVLIAGCGGGAYNDLQVAFPATTHFVGTKASPTSILFLSRRSMDDNREFRRTLQVTLLPSGIEFEPTFPLNLVLEPIFIPAEKIAACGRRCFGSSRWDADVLVETGTEISFGNSHEVANWCWESKKSLITTAERSEWLQEGKALPDANELAKRSQALLRDDYDPEQACKGHAQPSA